MPASEQTPPRSPAAWRSPTQWSPQAWVALGLGFLFLIFVGGLYSQPLMESAAGLVAIICLAFGVVFLHVFMRDPVERVIVLRLFIAAYLVRIAFTWLIYKAGLESLSGGEDNIWLLSWAQSRVWWAKAQGLYVASVPYDWAYPETFLSIWTTAKRNSAHNYFYTYFFYWLNVPSQMALAFVNCLAGAATTVVVYKTSRLFYSRKASLFAAMWAMLLPGVLVWSALTEKAVWVAFCQITGFYLFWRGMLARGMTTKFVSFSSAIFFTLLLQGMRFYAAYTQLLSLFVTLACRRSKRPILSAVVCICILLTVLIIGPRVGLMKIDVTSLAVEQVEMAQAYQRSMIRGSEGRESSIQFNYDLTTPKGVAQMVGTGSVYFWLAPFVWQTKNVRQALTLPDVFLWYYLLFVFLIPGLIHTLKHRPALAISVLFYIVPLSLAYSFSFANVGLAFRQRSQFIPFMLILVAAGYDWHQQRRALRRARAQADHILKVLDEIPAPSPQHQPPQHAPQLHEADQGRGP